MEITLTWQNIITAAAVCGAAAALITYCARLVRWVDRQRQQDTQIQAMRTHHEEDMANIKAEQALIVYGLLACLKGLKGQGCNGPVVEAINRLEKYLNKGAHK